MSLRSWRSARGLDQTVIRIGILTVSDGCARGEREDRSGALISAWCAEQGHETAAQEIAFFFSALDIVG